MVFLFLCTMPLILYFCFSIFPNLHATSGCVLVSVCSDAVTLGSMFFMTLAMMTRQRNKESENNLYSLCLTQTTALRLLSDS